MARALSSRHFFMRLSCTSGSVVSIYEIDEAVAFNECKVLKFDSPDDAWFYFAEQNRIKGEIQRDYDLVYGPVANDTVYQTFRLYETGLLTSAQAKENLKVKKLYNQLVFKTEKSLSFIKFLKSETV
ncbi:MAG: DUF3990 domain-containing protein [Endomicrobia bacterium]|nr:DUF3990 domain-containing protein [Endomicrobiia bacterium]